MKKKKKTLQDKQPKYVPLAFKVCKINTVDDIGPLKILLQTGKFEWNFNMETITNS